MTVRVLKPATEWQIECARCGSTLAYSLIDIREIETSRGCWGHEIDCPVCNNESQATRTVIAVPDEPNRTPNGNSLIEFLDILESNKYRASIDPTRRQPGDVFFVRLRKGTTDLSVTIREKELSAYSGMDLCILATLKELKDKLDLKLEATSKKRSASE